MSTRRVSVKTCQRESFPGCGELVGRLPPYTNGGAGVKRLRKGLEAEAGSQRDDACSESRLSSAEARVAYARAARGGYAACVGWDGGFAANVSRDAIRLEVQIVEQVVGINPEFNPGAFAEYGHLGQAKGLGQRHVHVPVSRPGERVATYSGLGKRGSGVATAKRSVAWKREIRLGTLGIVRTSLELIVACARTDASPRPEKHCSYPGRKRPRGPRRQSAG